MRRLQAIIVLIALLSAPGAMFAGVWAGAYAAPVCTMACCRHGKCLMQKHRECQGSQPSMQCDCMEMPGFWLLAPLPQTVLPRPIPAPTLLATRAASAAAPRFLPLGFLPEPFLPPRG